MRARMHTRRAVLARMATIAGSAFLGRDLSHARGAPDAPRYNPILSAQTSMWIQHFRSRNIALEDGVEESLAVMRRAGFRRVELMADFLRAGLRAKTLALLRKNRLEVPTVYVGSVLHESQAAEKSVAEILELAQGLRSAGVRALVTNPSPKPDRGRKSDEELALQARALNRLGGELRKHGMRFMVHHHTPELVEDGREWRHQLQHTDPDLVHCCVDVDWAVRGGQEPLAFLREAGARLASLHLRNSRNGVWLEDFGEGDIDYRKVADYLKQTNFDQYLVVELYYEKKTEITRSLEENLLRSRVYARTVFDLRSA